MQTKEVASLNMRVLTVFPGIINTNVDNAVVLGQKPMPGDYGRSVAEHAMHFLSSGELFSNGDKDKAMKALYEVVKGCRSRTRS